jgi:translation elongation factor EF-G
LKSYRQWRLLGTPWARLLAGIGFEAGTAAGAMMPETEIGDLIIEVRSATAGVGSFTFKFDHMADSPASPLSRSYKTAAN